MYSGIIHLLPISRDSVGDFFIENSTVILILALIVFLVVYLLFVCVEVVRRKKPWNAIMYFLMVNYNHYPSSIKCTHVFIFQVESMSLILLYVMIQYNLKVIAIAVAGTAILCLLMTLVATLAPVWTRSSLQHSFIFTQLSSTGWFHWLGWISDNRQFSSDAIRNCYNNCFIFLQHLYPDDGLCFSCNLARKFGEWYW